MASALAARRARPHASTSLPSRRPVHGRAPRGGLRDSAEAAVISLTIIVAALNEEENLAAAIDAIHGAYEPLGIPYEILIFDDHSTDRTGEVADSLARAHPSVQVIHNGERLNIGGIDKAGLQR